MALFQKIVQKKYLNNIPKEKIEASYIKYRKHFADEKRILRIKLLKEEQYQEGFLRELFVDCLNYTINPNENFNLTTEFKNKTDSEKADGAVLKDKKPIAVIELKSTKTRNLKSIEKQAFNYKAHQSNCKYVITSNFEKIRLYIDDATEFIEFDVFHLSKDEFSNLYLSLSYWSISNDIPSEIKEKSNQHEEQISKKLYKDYFNFRNNIFENLVKNNPQISKLILFKKSQKLLDRFLFIFFAEDKGLIPANIISKIIEDYNKLKEMDHYTPLYNEFKRFFGYINQGNEKYNIDAYNGGLFQFDEILDNAIIDDEILINDSLSLSNYDFDSEIDVNILGHIFEHSLTDIEKLNAEISGENLDRKQTRRKKEGVFYTPNYITKYIVENTVGTLCSEKKQELDLNDLVIDETYFKKSKKGNVNNSKKGEQLLVKLNDYKEWLLSLKILDPACGSGAFLNQALNYLIDEHKLIIDLETELRKGQLSFFDIDTAILENNLYGVDINEESVEIAKLSLWLKTAKKGRKLTNLSKHIKCGNSLIDDPDIAGDKAFNWSKEFHEIMESGGFNVVIGNPPYVQLQKLGQSSKDIELSNYLTYERTGDLYCLFYELGNMVLKNKGLLGYITSNKWMRANYGKKLRKYFVDNTNPKILINLGSNIFKSASVDSNIFIFEKHKISKLRLIALDISKEKELTDFKYHLPKSINITDLSEKIWSITNPIEYQIKKKIEQIGSPLSDWNIEINYGIKTGYNNAFIIDNKLRNELIMQDPKSHQIIEPVLRGRDVKRYNIDYQNLYLINSHNGYKDNERINIDDYPAIKAHLRKFDIQLAKRYDKGDTPYNLRSCSYLDNFKQEKIIWKEMSSKTPFCIDKSGKYSNDTITFITGSNLYYLLSILNSNFVYYLFCNFYSGGGLGNKGLRFKKEFIRNIPIPIVINETQQPFINKANTMLSLNEQKQETINKLLHRLESNFEIDKLSNKIKAFYDYDFKTIISELKKKKIKLSLTEQDEWEDYFNTHQIEINRIQDQINQTDKEIDKMVYELYGLTDEERRIVESN